MTNGLAKHPWRAYFILAFAFVATQLATLAAPPLVYWIQNYLWTNHLISLHHGYSLINISSSEGIVYCFYYTMKNLCIYVFPFLIVVWILSTRMPTWMSIVVGLLFSISFGLYTLFTEKQFYGYVHALEAYLGSQISCALGSIACFVYRGSVSVRQPPGEDED
ncbi:hypothetical protein BH11PLA2_BH11PLA2_36080 [soil metagenome]